MDMPRYSIYYTPKKNSLFEALGSSLLGRDLYGKEIMRPSFKWNFKNSLEEITKSTRHYALHATMKAPFELSKEFSERDLCESLETFCNNQELFELPKLEVGTIRDSNFIALKLSDTCENLASLEKNIVTKFDKFRAELKQEDIERRKYINEKQKEYLLEFGYPFIFDEFCFHISLTDNISDNEELQKMIEFFSNYFEVVCEKNENFDGLALFYQENRKSDFILKQYFSFNKGIINE